MLTNSASYGQPNAGHMDVELDGQDQMAKIAKPLDQVGIDHVIIRDFALWLPSELNECTLIRYDIWPCGCPLVMSVLVLALYFHSK